MNPGYWYPLASPTIGEEEIEAGVAVLRSGQTTMGEVVEEFEHAFARYVDADHAVMVNSGSSADLLLAFALPADEVIMPAVTWPTHVWSFHTADHMVSFCDVDGFNTTAELMEKRIKSNGSILGLVHLMGVPCDMDEMCSLAAAYDLTIVEDCCEALGATYNERPVGSFGKAATWSFFFSHQMTTMEGGMITTGDKSLADRLRSMRSHGWARHQGDKHTFIEHGFNLRPTEVSAAIGLVQLQKLGGMNKLRAENRAAFVNLLDGLGAVSFPAVPVGARPSWFGLPMLVHDDRDGLMRHLEWSGVETRPILGGNLARQPAFSEFRFRHVPGADYVHDHGLYIGLHPDADSGIDEVALLVGEYLA